MITEKLFDNWKVIQIADQLNHISMHRFPELTCVNTGM